MEKLLVSLLETKYGTGLLDCNMGLEFRREHNSSTLNECRLLLATGIDLM